MNRLSTEWLKTVLSVKLKSRVPSVTWLFRWRRSTFCARMVSPPVEMRKLVVWCRTIPMAAARRPMWVLISRKSERSWGRAADAHSSGQKRSLSEPSSVVVMHQIRSIRRCAVTALSSPQAVCCADRMHCCPSGSKCLDGGCVGLLRSLVKVCASELDCSTNCPSTDSSDDFDLQESFNDTFDIISMWIR